MAIIPDKLVPQSSKISVCDCYYLLFVWLPKTSTSKIQHGKPYSCYLQKSKNNVSAVDWPTLTKLGTMMHLNPPDLTGH